MGDMPQEPDYSEFVEVDPTGRYGRYNEILGKGASKTVYRAFDEYEGIEVAWNQVKLFDFLQSPEELERLYCEIHLLKTLKHKNIMKFYTSWVDTSKRNINFVTEMFTSGTLRQYRQKHRRVNIRAVKHWCRQILRGLLYLHSHDPPVIHRDLKCDNIFINGNQGEVKIGDLGLAAILRKSHAAHCVGTPEFMAPEVYEEEYNELVDIYSFGMCILEMVTLEYPYSECTHPVQIYKKVISGTKPEALYKVKEPEVRQFVEKCLATASRRLPAKELLKDPFLRIDDGDLSSGDLDAGDLCPLLRQPSFSPHYSNGSLISNGFCNGLPHELENGWDYDHIDLEPHGIELFSFQEDDPFPNVDITIKGRRREDGRIFLRLRISDKEGRIRNIYFPFDIEADTALSVATEMVAELDITDYDVTRIAEMIDAEICSMVPEWRPGPGIEDTPGHPTSAICHNCASNVSSIGSLLDYSPGCSNLQGGLRCTRLGCAAAMHGRFEEITYQVDGSEECVTEGAPVLSSHSEGHDTCSPSSRETHSDEGSKHSYQPVKNQSSAQVNIHGQSAATGTLGELFRVPVDQQCLELSTASCRKPPPTLSNDYENEIRQELGWLKAKCQMELRDYKSRRFGGSKRSSSPLSELDYRDLRVRNGAADSSLLGSSQRSTEEMFQSLHLGEQPNLSHRLHGGNVEGPSPVTGSSARTDGGLYWSSRFSPESRRPRHCEVNSESSPESMFTAKNFYGGLLPSGLPRTKSLPVDAVDG